MPPTLYCGGQPLNTDVRVCYDRSSHAEMLTQTELQAVTTVFRNFETGLREASIDTKVTHSNILYSENEFKILGKIRKVKIFFEDLLAAMKMLGLNPMEQEIVDVTNEIAKNGLIFFPEFCEVVLARFRAEDEEAFNENMFKVRE